MLPLFVTALVALGCQVRHVGPVLSRTSMASQLVGAEVHTRRSDTADVRRLDSTAASLAQAGRLTEALALWQRAIELRPNDFVAHHNAGLMLELLGRYDEALAEFRAGLRLTTDSAVLQAVYWHLGVAQYHLGRFADSRTSFREAWQRDTADVRALSFAAVSSVRLGDFEKALSYWTAVLRIRPSYFDEAPATERELYGRVKAALRR